MELVEKIQAVKDVFNVLDTEIALFQENTKLGCKSGCGECCKKPDIEATILEFLPLAFHLYKENLVDVFLDKIKNKNIIDNTENAQNEVKNDGICVLFAPFLPNGKTGYCTIYDHRGLICRLFGFSATTNKNGEKLLATCRIIKENYKEDYEKAVEGIKNGGFIPLIRDFYYKMYAIDLNLAEGRLPINEAIKRALEIVATYFYYANQEK